MQNDDIFRADAHTECRATDPIGRSYSGELRGTVCEGLRQCTCCSNGAIAVGIQHSGRLSESSPGP